MLVVVFIMGQSCFYLAVTSIWERFFLSHFPSLMASVHPAFRGP